MRRAPDRHNHSSSHARAAAGPLQQRHCSGRGHGTDRATESVQRCSHNASEEGGRGVVATPAPRAQQCALRSRPPPSRLRLPQPPPPAPPLLTPPQAPLQAPLQARPLASVQTRRASLRMPGGSGGGHGWHWPAPRAGAATKAVPAPPDAGTGGLRTRGEAFPMEILDSS